jgi:hypothetical protein
MQLPEKFKNLTGIHRIEAYAFITDFYPHKILVVVFILQPTGNGSA